MTQICSALDSVPWYRAYLNMYTLPRPSRPLVGLTQRARCSGFALQVDWGTLGPAVIVCLRKTGGVQSTSRFGRKR